jgi:hypothetical protein
MKASKMTAAGLAVAALLACCQAGEAAQKKKDRKDTSADRPLVSGAIGTSVGGNVGALAGGNMDGQTQPAPVDAEKAQVQELIKILNETKSPTTVLATAVALLPMGDKARLAVPALLRNAERLKMLDDLGNGNNSRKGEMAAMLVEVIYAIQAGWSPDNNNGNPLNRFGGPRSYGPAPIVSGNQQFMSPPPVQRAYPPTSQY